MADLNQTSVATAADMVTEASLCFTASTIVKVGAGETQRSFSVYDSVIRLRSTFFDAALSEKWKSSQDTVQLPEEDPYIFDLYLQCMYSNGARIVNSAFMKWFDSGFDDLFLTVVKVYVLADKMGDCASANAMMTSLTRIFLEKKIVPRSDSILYAYENTPSGSPLRRLMRDVFAYCASGMTFDDTPAAELLPHAFLLDVLREKVLAEAREGRRKARKTFGRDILRTATQRYHQYDRLHPEPAAVEDTVESNNNGASP